MKTLIGFLILCSFSLAQQPVQRQTPRLPVIEAAPQPAQDITIHLTAEMATAYEAARLNTPGSVSVDKATGAVSQTPRFATIAEYIAARLSVSLHRQILTEYPPPAVKAAKEAADKAKQDSDDAVAAAAGTPKDK